jgi:transposase-like protein
VSRRVSPTEQIRAQIDALFDGSADLAGALEKVARLGAQLIIQSAMEAEVQAVLGRARYQRRASIGDAPAGSRNGYRPVTVKTTTGPVTVARPRLRGTDGRFVSGLFGPHPTRTEALESLVVAGFVRGLSVRDVQATLTEALGAEASLSKSTVARVCQVIKTDFDAWANRRLDDLLLDYLFLDASHFRMHAGARAEPVLAAWGITTDGNPVLVGLAAANAESTDAWAEFLSGLDQRGLRSPLLIVCDGAAGLIAAIDQIYPRSLRQRCLIHYADPRIMPTLVPDSLAWQGFRVGEVGIIRVLRARRAGCRAAGSGRCVRWADGFWLALSPSIRGRRAGRSGWYRR